MAHQTRRGRAMCGAVRRRAGGGLLRGEWRRAEQTRRGRAFGVAVWLSVLLLLLLLRLLVQLDGQAVDLLLTQVRSSERNCQLLLQRMQIGWG